MIHPWQEQSWQHLLASHKKNSLPHALLLTGPKGLGKAHFAKAFADTLLCKSNADQACGQCRSCILIKAQTHPDLFLVSPEEEGKAIKVDQVRELIQKLTKTSQMATHQIVILNPADAMNIAAANALLKTLEEPAGQVILLLVTDRATSLPATIRSRCQQIAFKSPSNAMATAWLRDNLTTDHDIQTLLSLSENAPLRAKALAESDDLETRDTLTKGLVEITIGRTNPIQLAASYLKLECDFVLRFISTWTVDLIRLHFNAGNTTLFNQDKLKALTLVAEKTSLKKLYAFLDKVTDATKQISRQSNLNKQLLLEDLMLSYEKCTSGGK